jgi:hypothetical protein
MRTLIAYDGSPEGEGLLGAIPARFPASTARVLTIYEGPHGHARARGTRARIAHGWATRPR